MKELTDATFYEFVKSSNKLVLVDFWAPWCGPCKKLTPTLEFISVDFMDTVDFVKVNTDENMEVPKDFEIMSIPSLLLFHKGEFQGQISSSGSASALRERIAASVEQFK